MLELVAYIITFLGASILNIAAGQPFSASQILYITSSSTRRSASPSAWTRRRPG